MKDTYGIGLTSYLKGNKNAQFVVESDYATTDTWQVADFFHSYDEMGEIERRAVTMAKGRTLDVGAGSGSHSLWLQNHNVDVTALDISSLATDVCRQQGVRNVICGDFFNLSNEKYDTLLFLMNGVGICQTMDKLDTLLSHAKGLLAEGGQILMDSADLMYLYEMEDGTIRLPLDRYYGEFRYRFVFEGEKGDEFGWLFVDFDNLKAAAERTGLKCEKVYEGDMSDYLARLTAEQPA